MFSKCLEHENQINTQSFRVVNHTDGWPESTLNYRKACAGTAIVYCISYLSVLVMLSLETGGGHVAHLTHLASTVRRQSGEEAHKLLKVITGPITALKQLKTIWGSDRIRKQKWQTKKHHTTFRELIISQITNWCIKKQPSNMLVLGMWQEANITWENNPKSYIKTST